MQEKVVFRYFTLFLIVIVLVVVLIFLRSTTLTGSASLIGSTVLKAGASKDLFMGILVIIFLFVVVYITKKFLFTHKEKKKEGYVKVNVKK